jgi:hypothetical protein
MASRLEHGREEPPSQVIHDQLQFMTARKEGNSLEGGQAQQSPNQTQPKELESSESVPLTFKEWTTENNEATAEDRPLPAESALDRDTQEYIHYLLDGKFNPRYLESFGELLSAIRESEMKNFDFVPPDRAILILARLRDFEIGIEHDGVCDQPTREFGIRELLNMHST